MHEVNTSTSPELASIVDELSRKMNLLLRKNALVNDKCAYCGALGYDEMSCGMARRAGDGVGFEDVNFVGGFLNAQPRNDPYANTYNPSWRNHPNFSWNDPTS